MSIALLSSCLKDSKYTVDFTKTTPLVELPGAANVSGNAGTFEVVGLLASSAPSPFNVAVNLAAPQPLSKAITVKLSVDAAALTAYNTANETSYTLLPTADFTSSLSVTIPAGQNLVNLVVNVETSKLDPTQTYVLPLTITDGGGIQISNYKTILYQLTVKNAYDDTYTETGYKFHPNPASCHALTGSIPVVTVSAVTSNTAVGDLGGSGYSFNFDVSSSNALENWVPEGATPAASSFLISDDTGTTTYAPSDGSGAQPGTAPYVQTTYNNTYDPAAKTFWMHYGYFGGTGLRDFYVKLVAQ